MRSNLTVSICVPAYNEEKNIGVLLSALLTQKTESIEINKIIVVCSGCTDNTEQIVRDFIRKDSRIVLLCQSERHGKVAAINLFLEQAKSEVVVLISADVIPTDYTLEKLCEKFIKEDNLGLTGGAPYPINNPKTFSGYLVNTWWFIHRAIPRYGEIIAFKNIIRKIPEDIAVDEAYIQAWFEKGGYKLHFVPDAIVTNKGADSIKDLIQQRRRIFNGHSRLKQQIGYTVDSFNNKAFRNLLGIIEIRNAKHLLWLAGGLTIEVYARVLGFYDIHIKNYNPYIWDQAKTTKQVIEHNRMQAYRYQKLSLILRSLSVTNQEPITIIGNYGNGNLGDELLLRAVAEDLGKSMFTNIGVIVRNPNAVEVKAKEIQLFSALSLHSLRRYLGSNVVVIGPGGLFGKDIGPIARFLPVYALVAKLLGKRVVFYAFGIYNATPKLIHKLVGLACYFADYVCVRDRHSFNGLRQYQKLRGKVVLVYDPAWQFTDKLQKDSQEKRSSNYLIGISLRYVEPITERKKLLSTVADGLNSINLKNVTFIPLNFYTEPKNLIIKRAHPSDSVMIAELLKQIKRTIAIAKNKENLTTDEAIGIYNTLHGVIAMRFHPQVLAILRGLPLLAIGYSPKNEISQELGKATYIGYQDLTKEHIISFLREVEK